ncbi:MAG: AMP-binding protein [Acidimicrobiales bacterium]|jgi:fatty-acyl-CoA synthase
MEWSLTAVQDLVSGEVPDRDMLVWEGVRKTHGEVVSRSRRLAAFLVERGIGVHRERPDLERWECGQSPVALILHNCPEYIEAMSGCFRARAVPFNVNHYYSAAEVRAVLNMVGAEAVIYHRSMAPMVADAVGDAPLLLIEIDDGPGTASIAGSVAYEKAIESQRDDIRLPDPSPDDLYLVCTGGTTGAPKAVVWRQADIFVSGMGGSEDATPDSLVATAARGIGTWFAASPLMHAAAQWTAFVCLHGGGTVVLHDDRNRFDAEKIIATLSREHVNLMSIVGDAYARPLVEALERNPVDLASLLVIGTGGAITSEENKQALLRLLPHVTIRDGYGASETGGMAFGSLSKNGATKGFAPGPGAVVISADRSRILDPGDDQLGWTARRGRVPLGYLNDPEKTVATFPVVAGVRLAVPGDRAMVEPDGSIRMLGRDSMVVNTGGEKVFVEEVEEALRSHPEVEDALVVGRPSDRFGQEVTAIVQLRSGALVAPNELREFVAKSIARFKAPRAVAFREVIKRQASGKPDYQWALDAARAAESATR